MADFIKSVLKSMFLIFTFNAIFIGRFLKIESFRLNTSKLYNFGNISLCFRIILCRYRYKFYKI